MSASTLDVISVAGARPNFMKIAPMAHALAAKEGVRHRIVHTGQHYDKNMSDTFFTELGIPEPWKNLGVGSASHAKQTAEIMVGFEEIIATDPPDVVMVVGDVNSTIACALVAVKAHVPVAHVEAGLRSFDMRMPEEINRVLTDRISDSLFVTEPSGMANLAAEGVSTDRTWMVGNVMIDTLLAHLDRARASDALHRIGVAEKSYGVVTLHRPSNVDDPATLRGIFGALEEIAGRCPLVFPVHPRTASRMEAAGLRLDPERGFVTCDPLGYVDFLRVMESAKIILTDSGGIQEEACLLGTPVLTMRENTERPITIDIGMNQLVGSDPDAILRAATGILDGDRVTPAAPDLWDGKAAERIADILVQRYGRTV
ncbi:MAG: UDP-N-acetylglucosamine 2-epimerase (non-hydrolyzing) [Planctomycetes bacterium]|nr:UDP-N-acetylglucosamine 2-epimerase (non-hydrolyzing) [Planctomycetota bacterium]